MVDVECRDLTRRFATGGGVEAMSFSVARGERVAIVGPSGAGKSTILRLLAGLESPESGSILLGGRDASRLRPHERGVAFALQGQPPFPHLDVAGNLGFSLRARGVSAIEARPRIDSVAEGLGLKNLLSRRPDRLSGGERQRVVLGRSIAAGASLTLLDEPFSSLDPLLSASIRDDLIRLHDRTGGTWIIVTHDQADALAFGQRVAVIAGGRMVQFDAPDSLLDGPVDRFVATFLAGPELSMLRGTIDVQEDGVRVSGLVEGAAWRIPDGHELIGSFRRRGSGPIELRVRPWLLAGMIDPPADPFSLVVGVSIVRVERSAFGRFAVGKLGEQSIRVALDRGLRVGPGDRVLVQLPLASALWFDPIDGGRRLDCE